MTGFANAWAELVPTVTAITLVACAMPHSVSSATRERTYFMLPTRSQADDDASPSHTDPRQQALARSQACPISSTSHRTDRHAEPRETAGIRHSKTTERDRRAAHRNRPSTSFQAGRTVPPQTPEPCGGCGRALKPDRPLR